MWFRNQFSQTSRIGSPAASTRFYASDSPDRPTGKHANLSEPEDYLRMKEWITRVQVAAQKARDEHTEDEAVRARQLQNSSPDFETENTLKFCEDQDVPADDSDDESA